MSKIISDRTAEEFWSSVDSFDSADWAYALNIDMAMLSMEAFWHPVAQWENARIAKQGEEYWAWRRFQNPEPPTVVARMEAKARPMFDFTEKQLALGMKLLGAEKV